MEDAEIVNGLMYNNEQRALVEKQFYHKYNYFIREGCVKFHLTYDDSFSAYSDTLLAAIKNIVNNRFDSSYSLKTYLFQIYSNKCVDIIRKITNNKQRVNKSAAEPELLNHLPDAARNAIERLIDLEKIKSIKECLDTIGEKCKEILLLFEDGYTDKEIAEKLSFHNPAVAKTTRLRCRKKIKSLFFDNEQHR